MNASPRILYVAPRPACPSTSGQVLMYRHLTALGPRFITCAAHTVGATLSNPSFDLLPLSPLYLRLSRTRCRRWTEGINALTGFALPRRHVASAIARHRPDILVVVAEWPVFLPAVAAARHARLPVVSIVHDWSTVWLDIPRRLHPSADRAFLAHCRRSTATLNVSPELAAAIGSQDRHRLLYPIPGGGEIPGAELAEPRNPFQALYAGIFHYFHGAEMADLCGELLRRQRPDLLRLHGPEPDWTSPLAEPVRTGNFYAGLVSQSQLPPLLAAAGALLVICPFSEHLTQFARFSFPSKLTEYCRFGRPIVLWGPPHSAAVRWAERSGAVRIVTERNPAAVVDALLELERAPELRLRFGRAALHEAKTTFHPDRLNAIFEGALHDALARAPRSRQAPPPVPAHG